MNDLRTAAQQALEFIRAMNSHGWLLADYESDMERTVSGLEAALAQEQAEPVADLRCAKWLDPECADKGACQSLKFKRPAEPVQEPVAWMLIEREKYGNAVVLRRHKPKTYDGNWWTLTPLYTTPPHPRPSR